MLAVVSASRARVAVLALVGGLLVAVMGAVAHPAMAAHSAKAGKVLTTTSTSVGTVLVDAKGRTVYVFAADRPGRSTCSGDCLRAWPAVVAPSTLPTSVPGITGRLGVLKRPDGTRQLTINGRPLYRFAGDAVKGDIKGQGVDGFGAKWWTVSPAGKAVTTMPPGGSEGGSSGGSDDGSSGDSGGYAY